MVQSLEDIRDGEARSAEFYCHTGQREFAVATFQRLAIPQAIVIDEIGQPSPANNFGEFIISVPDDQNFLADSLLQNYQELYESADGGRIR